MEWLWSVQDHPPECEVLSTSGPPCQPKAHLFICAVRGFAMYVEQQETVIKRLAVYNTFHCLYWRTVLCHRAFEAGTQETLP